MTIISIIGAIVIVYIVVNLHTELLSLGPGEKTQCSLE